MNKSRTLVLFFVVAAVSIIAGFLFFMWQERDRPAPPFNTELLFNSSFKDLQGKQQSLGQWRGNVLVVNFWATWCPPCREEIPEFIKIQDKYRDKNLKFIGIAIDQKDKVQAFADEMSINYPMLIGELDAVELSRKAGNRLGGLPYSIVIDRNGTIADTYFGEVKPAKLESTLQRLLQ